MDWPPQSPDRNIAEVVWDHLDGERQPISTEALNVLQDTWRTIPERHDKKAVLKNEAVRAVQTKLYFHVCICMFQWGGPRSLQCSYYTFCYHMENSTANN